MSLQEEMNYCVYLDMLGYRSIVTSNKFSTKEKVAILNDIYLNMLTIAFNKKQMTYLVDKDFFIKSFSDCVYMETKDPIVLLYTMHTIFNVAFGYNSNFSDTEKYSPLLRCGIVRDWTLKLMDIGSLSRQPLDTMHGNQEFQNPVGLGVARAYETSELSHVSGMRIIISEEVINNIELIKYNDVPFECYFIDCPNFLKIHDSHEFSKLFFMPIAGNSKLFELCWPVFSYNHHRKNSDIEVHIKELNKRIWQFDSLESRRHLKETATLLYKAWQITLSLSPGDYSTEDVKNYTDRLLEVVLEQGN